MDKKGISPVIATILLIALTVAAVGIVAAILSGMGTPTAGPTASLTLKGHYYPRYEDDNSTCIQISHAGGDTIPDQDMYVTFRAKLYGREYGDAVDVKGTIDGMGTTAGPTITWTSGWSGTTACDSNTTGEGKVMIPYNPGDMVAGTTWELVFMMENNDENVFDILEFSLVHKTSSIVVFQNLAISAPSVLA